MGPPAFGHVHRHPASAALGAGLGSLHSCHTAPLPRSPSHHLRCVALVCHRPAGRRRSRRGHRLQPACQRQDHSAENGTTRQSGQSQYSHNIIGILAPASTFSPQTWPHALSADPASAAAHNGSSNEVENLVIIGSGPAGYTAAIYAARANMRPLVFEGFQAGGSQGGQLMTTNEVENFPGFPEGITGPDLMDRMRAQAERWGAQLFTEDVEEVDFGTRPFTIRSTERTARAHSVVVATGATARKLNIPSEGQFWSSGISACAICDGASSSFRGQDLAVVGGGDTAAEEAIYLTKYGKHVHLLVRGEKMRASGAMQDRVQAHERVTVHYSTRVEDAYGDGKGLAGLRLLEGPDDERHNLSVRGLFYGIGHQPNSGIYGGQLELDEAGYVQLKQGCQTSIEGVFSAGDLHDHEWRQAITAAGSGCMAALSAERYLSEKGLLREFHLGAQESSEEKKPSTATATVDEEDESTIDVTKVKHKGQFALRHLYHASNRLLVVLYTQPSCGPCRTLKPVLSKVVDEFHDKIHLIEIDIEKDRQIAEAGGVGGTPTVQFFKQKERLHHMPGVKQKSEYRNLISSNL